ncbi:hypothetical protein KIPB_002103, partial [Kipferlia bialata]
GWISRSDSNVLLGACALGLCTSSVIQPLVEEDNMYKATDGNQSYTSYTVQQETLTQSSWFRVYLPTPQPLESLYVRGAWRQTLNVDLYDSEDTLLERVEIGYSTSTLQSTLSATVQGTDVAYIEMSVDMDPLGLGYCYAGKCGDCVSFRINEIAAYPPSFVSNEWVDLTLSESTSVETVSIVGNFEYGDAATINLLASTDGVEYTQIDTVTGDDMSAEITRVLSEPVFCTHIRAQFLFDTDRESGKVEVTSMSLTSSDVTDASIDVASSVQTDTKDTSTSCEAGWVGDGCNTPICPLDCLGRGTCTAPGVCECGSEYVGKDCRYSMYMGDAILDTDVMAQYVGTRTPTPNRSTEEYVSASCPSDAPFMCPGTSECKASRGACLTNPPLTMEGVYAEAYTPTAVTVSSHDSSTENIIDGDTATFWQSGMCLPTDYITRESVNGLLGVCATAGVCESSDPTLAEEGSLISRLTDGTSASVTIEAGEGEGGDLTAAAWVSVPLPTPISSQELLHISIRHTGMESDSITVYLQLNDSPSSTLEVAALTADDVYDYVLLSVPDTGDLLATAVVVASDADFSLGTVAAQTSPCTEWACLDLGEAKPVGALEIRHWVGSTSGLVTSTEYQGSTDNETWDTLREADPHSLYALDVAVEPAQSYRYIRVVHTMAAEAQAKVYVWMMAVYDADGQYGPAPTAAANDRTIHELLGVNSIWSMGVGWSNLAHDGLGPNRFSHMASHGRNYHSLGWDIEEPGQAGEFTLMSAGDGTTSTWWQNWDWEYGGWRGAGLDVQACVMINEDTFPEEDWGEDPAIHANTYGYSFARHFGPLHGTGDVGVMEVGNEPWDYSSAFYGSLLKGMAAGVKQADPSLEVLPAHLETLDDLNEAFAVSSLDDIDGINFHTYSWRGGDDGRAGEHPESLVSSFRSIHELVRYRDTNAPSLPLYVSEWGWDSEGADEECVMSMCVSEAQQALYLVRGTLLMARLGVHRASVFYYANSDSVMPEVFSRSGLTGSSDTGHERKTSLYALEHMVDVFGDATFEGVVREDTEAYVYKFTDAALDRDLYIAWRPVAEADRTDTVDVSLSVSSFSAAYTLGDRDLRATTGTCTGDSCTFSVSPYPTVVVVSADAPVCGTLDIASVKVTALTKVIESMCNNGMCASDGVCSCDEGYMGDYCAETRCENDCWNHGSCVDGVCVCETWYSASSSAACDDATEAGECTHVWDPATSCRYAICPSSTDDVCSGNGTCVTGECQCSTGWGGDDCSEVACPYDCREHGTCTEGVCTCLDDDDVVSALMDASTGCTWVSETEDMPEDMSELCPDALPFLCEATGECAVSRGMCVEPTAMSMVGVYASPLSATVSVSSNHDSADNVTDEYTATFWQSGTCLPTGYIVRSDINGLLGMCDTQGVCTYSGTDTDLSHVTDGMSTTVLTAPVDSTTSIAYVDVPLGVSAIAVSVRISSMDSAVTLSVVQSGERVTLATLEGTDDIRTVFRYILPSTDSVHSVRLESAGQFSVSFLAAQTSVCTEWAVTDLGAQTEVGAVRIRHWAGSSDAEVVSTVYQHSTDLSTWITLLSPDPYDLEKVDIDMGGVTTRYIRVLHTLAEEASLKVYVWEIDAFDTDGPYGPFPSASPNPRTLSQMLGVNGIWGWGSTQDGDLPEGSDYIDASTFGPLGRHGRSYHNWEWDVETPQETPDYANMAETGFDGELAMNWLNWDNQYKRWNLGGLSVQASLQFYESSWPESLWVPDAQTAGALTGSAFATHFGPTEGTGDVRVLEVGNEPWGYTPEFYGDILKGVGAGAKEADPALEILPAHLETLENLAAALDVSGLESIDGMNYHTYSWRGAPGGKVGEHPESIVSSFGSLKENIRFTDTNTPTLPVYVSEWGWDSHSTGDRCTQSTCVSEAHQAVYLVRGALILSRLGVHRASMFFYADTSNCGTDDETIFSCSGLVGNKVSGFARKTSYTAMAELVGTYGDLTFESVISESDTAYVYSMLGGDDHTTVYHVLWKPTDDLVATSVYPLTTPTGAVSAVGHSLGHAAPTSQTLTVVDGAVSVPVSAYPIVLEYTLSTTSPTDPTDPTDPGNAAYVPTRSVSVLMAVVGLMLAILVLA